MTPTSTFTQLLSSDPFLTDHAFEYRARVTYLVWGMGGGGGGGGGGVRRVNYISGTDR